MELRRAPRRRLSRFDGAVVAVLVLSRLALFAVDAPNRAATARGEMPVYEAVYLGLDESLVATGQYRFALQEPFSDLRRPPGYPLLLAATVAVAGPGVSVAVLLWNVLGAVLLYLGLLRLLAAAGLRGRRAAALVLTADLAWLLYAREVVTEPVFTPLLVWGVVALLDAAHGPRPARAAARAGLLLGASALVKPISLYLPAIVVPFLLVVGVRRALRYGLFGGARVGLRGVRPVLAFAVAFAVCVGPWLVRNLVVHGVVSYTSIQNDNLLFAHGAFVRADARNLTHLDAQAELDAELTRRMAGRPETYAARNAEKGRLARDVLAEHPALYARALVRGAAVTLLDPGRLVFNRTFPAESRRDIGLLNVVARDGVWGAFRALVVRDWRLVLPLVLYLGFLAAVVAGAVAGVVPLWRASPVAFWLLVLVAAYLLGLGGPNGYARFRLYVFPFELVFLQAAAEAFLARRRSAPRLSAHAQTD